MECSGILVCASVHLDYSNRQLVNFFNGMGEGAWDVSGTALALMVRRQNLHFTKAKFWEFSLLCVTECSLGPLL